MLSSLCQDILSSIEVLELGFSEVTKLDQRRTLAYRVLAQECSLSQAAREFGVSRPTARLWVERARRDGLGALSERSRRPKGCPSAVAEDDARLLLAEKARHPVWGAKKLLARLWPSGEAPLSLRSANRVLSRNGLTCARPEARPADGRFERGGANELWQMDFKGLKYPRLPYEAFSVIDDSTRFCLGLVPLRSQSLDDVWGALWDLFGSYGLPDCVLSDTGPAFRAGAGKLHIATARKTSKRSSRNLRSRITRLTRFIGQFPAHGVPTP